MLTDEKFFKSFMKTDDFVQKSSFCHWKNSYRVTDAAFVIGSFLTAVEKYMGSGHQTGFFPSINKQYGKKSLLLYCNINWTFGLDSSLLHQLDGLESNPALM